MRDQATTAGRILAAAFLLLLIGVSALATDFPRLSGRVVDEAGLLSATARRHLTDILAAHEARTTNQVVVVTIRTLAGLPIADYGYQLGRHWGIGQKNRNNGVLLIVAAQEKRLRIEVGYGLEGTLTDAAASTIVNQLILPEFRAKGAEAGIVAGTRAILAILEGDRTALAALKPAAPPGREEPHWLLVVGVLVLIFGILAFLRGGPPGSGRRMLFHILLLLLTKGRSGRRGGRGGGFGGGGGSFGGGGASGGW